MGFDFSFYSLSKGVIKKRKIDYAKSPSCPIAEGSPLLLLAFCGCGEAGVGPP